MPNIWKKTKFGKHNAKKINVKLCVKGKMFFLKA